MTDAAKRELQPKSLLERISQLGKERVNVARKQLAGKSPAERRGILRRDWSNLLGPVALDAPPVVKTSATDKNLRWVERSSASCWKLSLESLSLIVLTPDKLPGRAPVVVAVAESGKRGFLKEQSTSLKNSSALGSLSPCLTFVVRENRWRTITTLSHLQLLVRPYSAKECAICAVLHYVRHRSDVDPKRIALWGDSVVPTNSANTNFSVPHRVDGWPQGSEPLGGLLVLLGALLEDDIRAVYIAGGLASYHDVLTHFAVLIPHGSSVPVALTAGDLADLAASLAPMPLRIASPVDHLNCALSVADMQRTYAACVETYAGTGNALSFAQERSSPASWLEQIR